MKELSRKSCQELCDIYGLGRMAHHEVLYVGFGKSIKTKVTTEQGDFVIAKNMRLRGKGINGKTRASLEYEIDMLQTVSDLPVQRFIPTCEGSFVASYDDAWITVYVFLEGRSPKKMTKQSVRQLGRFLGSFHKQTEQYTKEVASRRKFYELSDRVMKSMKVLVFDQNDSNLTDIAPMIEKGVAENRPPSQMPRGPIHVDLNAPNELFEGDVLTGVIDFGNFYIGERMIDVGKAIMFNCRSDGRLDLALVRSFLHAYQEERPFISAEKKYLPRAVLFGIYSHIWVDLYHVPLGYVPESYVKSLLSDYLPIARRLEKKFPKVLSSL